MISHVLSFQHLDKDQNKALSYLKVSELDAGIVQGFMSGWLPL